MFGGYPLDVNGMELHIEGHSVIVMVMAMVTVMVMVMVIKMTTTIQ